MAKLFRVRLYEEAYEVEVEATSVSDLLEGVRDITSDSATNALPPRSAAGPGRPVRKRSGPRSSGTTAERPTGRGDLMEIVTAIKDSDDYPAIEREILNKKAEVPRVLLACYFAGRVTDDPYLSSGDIETITNEFGVRIKASNVNGSFSGNSSKYFTADRVRRKGVTIRHKLNRVGESAILAMIAKPTTDGR